MTSTEISVDQDRLIQLAQSLIRIPSFTYQETEVARFLHSYLLGAGFEVELQEVPLKDRPASHQVVARWRGAKAGPKVLLCGHLDILEIYRPETWRTDPFGAVVSEGWLYGSGSLNMKAGVAAIIAAVEGLKQGGFDLHGEIVIAGVMGEICGGVGIGHLLKQERDFDYGLVTEPSNLDVATIAVGTGQGRLRLWGDTLYFNPHPSAISAMGKVLEALGPAYGPQEPGRWMTFEPCPDLPGYPRFGVRKIVSGQDYCEVFFDSRLVPGQTNASVLADLTNLVDTLRAELPGIRAEIHVPVMPETTNFPAMPATPADHFLVQALVKSHTNVLGKPPLVGAGARMGLASDGSHMKAAGIPTVDYGPGKHPRWPMVDERIGVADVVAAARVVQGMLRELHG